MDGKDCDSAFQGHNNGKLNIVSQRSFWNYATILRLTKRAKETH